MRTLDVMYVHICTYIYIHTYIFVYLFTVLMKERDGEINICSIDMVPEICDHSSAVKDSLKAFAAARFLKLFQVPTLKPIKLEIQIDGFPIHTGQPQTFS